MASDVFVESEWNPWLGEVLQHPYKRTEKDGIGNGELRLSHTLKIAICGPNSPYDFEYNNSEADAKQLDKGSFNTGVKGRDALRPIKSAISTFLSNIPSLLEIGKENLSDKLKENLNDLVKKSPDEFCESTLKKFQETMDLLNSLREELEGELIEKEIFLPSGEKSNVTSDIWYNVLVSHKYDESHIRIEMGDIIFENARLYNTLGDPYILEPNKLMDDLNSLKNIFKGMWLFFVDENKGYYPVYEPCNIVEFQRITKGTARFVVINTPELVDIKKKELTVAELRKQCKEAGIRNYSRASRQELIERLANKHQGAS